MNESFYALSPTDNVTNADHYYAALDWALLDQDTQGNPSLRQNTQGNPPLRQNTQGNPPLRQDERVRNVALAGPYGSGKSSILKAYQSKRKDTGLHFLYISLAKFNDNKEKTEDEEKVSNKKEKADERAVQVTGNLKDSKEKADEEVGKEEKAIEDETANEKNRKKGDEQQTEDGKNEVKERTKKIVETETTEDKEKKMRLIEQSILQQLFCREANDILPNSSFKKIDNIKAKIWAWGNIRFIVYVFLFLFALIYVKNPNDFAIWISHLGLGNAWWIHAVALSFLLLTLWIFAGIARVIISKVKINHFTFNHAGIEGKIEIDPKNMSESMLNKSLNEILYFFEATNYNVVVIEDLDRFHNTEIFSKLRELNSLINGYKKIGRNIVFIYAICDDFFEGDDRTKFFDFIIPVMPVVSANSSYGELEKALKGNSNKLSTDLERAMTDLSFYINDMRLLHNVVNEYNIIYSKWDKEKETEKTLELKESDLLATMIYKSRYPDDFAKLLKNEGGILHTAITDYRSNGHRIDDLFKENKAVSGDQQRLIRKLLKNEYIDEDCLCYLHGGGLSENDKQFLSDVSNKQSNKFDYPLDYIGVLLNVIPVESFAEEYILNDRIVDYLLKYTTRFQEKRENIFQLMSDHSATSDEFVNKFIARKGSDLAKFVKVIVCYWIEKERSAKIEEYNEISLRMGGATEEQIKKLREFYKRQEEQQGQEQQQRQEQEQQQEQQQGQAIVFEDLEIEMIHVKGGPFRMGSIKYDDEKPIHEVILSGFFIGKYVVTQAQWTKIMGNNPSYNAQGGNYPVECVSWDDAQDFCARLNMLTGKSYRLPTEAEWEYAARGGNQSQGYEYSGSKKLDEVGWYGENSEGSTHPVGDKSKTANELGIHDMSGNVWEWCSDWYGEYPATPQKNPSGPSRGSFRVSRGGSWFNYAKSCRSANRNYYDPLNRFNVLGFRVAASASF